LKLSGSIKGSVVANATERLRGDWYPALKGWAKLKAPLTRRRSGGVEKEKGVA